MKKTTEFRINASSLRIASAFLVAVSLTTACGDDGGDDTGTGNPAADGSTTDPSTSSTTTGTTGSGTESGSTGTSGGGSTEGGDTTGGDVDPPEGVYAFDSRFAPGTSSVSYSGQSARHALISALNGYIGGLTAAIDNADVIPVAGEIKSALDFYFRFDGETSGGEAHGITTTPATLQTSFNDISSGKDLVGKIAGNDPDGQHRDWSMGTDGWGDGTLSPEQIVDAWFMALDAMAVDRANGTIPQDPLGNPVGQVYVDAQGRDYKQLIQKFLLGAIGFSQGADDYLDDDFPGKGLLADNTVAVDGKAYSALEHAWDEGFGYYGASRDNGTHTDDHIKNVGYHDTNADGAIDLTSEYNFGNCVNSAKRDLGSNAMAPTDFSADAFNAFHAGRTLITSTAGALDEAALTTLRGHRDQALGAWEKAVAATVVHYINDTLKDMNTWGTAEYSFADHAKHWSELKGFALGLQFNRLSPVSDGDFVAFHNLIGDAPVLPNSDGAAAYKTALVEARTILGNAYGFNALNLGDANGEGGW